MGDPLQQDDFDDAFPALFHDAYDVTYRILGDVDEAEDAAADALVQARLHWTKVGPMANRDAWVLRAAVNVAIARVRRSGIPPLDLSVGPADADKVVLHAAVVAALAKLSRREREVVGLRYVAGLSEQEVAACLGISVNSVKRHMLRATTSLGDRVGHGRNKGEPVAS